MALDASKLKELDSHWSEVMELAKGYGFITQAYGGTAILMTHRNQFEALGEECYINQQRVMFGKNMQISE